MIRAIQVAAGSLLLLLAASFLPAKAQSDYRGTPAQQAACRPDVFRLCAGEIPNVRAITACLRRKLPQLSPGCAAVFEAAPR